MGKFSGLLMVSDLDRTLFGDKSVKLILPENNTAIEYFIENGGFFTFATGRSLVAARELTVDIPKNAPAILFNGQMIYDFNKDHILFSDEIYDENIKIFLLSDKQRNFKRFFGRDLSEDKRIFEKEKVVLYSRE